MMGILHLEFGQKVRKAGHIVMTNPDMLHSGILPHHTKWVSLFENLQYIVIDELHTYKGVFGSTCSACHSTSSNEFVLFMEPILFLFVRLRRLKIRKN